SDKAVEAIARSELGLIKEDEVFYQIVEIPEVEADSF
ncbi:MAG: septum formation initiator family protein, partial [Gammaproteobacteria bacterium]|nr:septum formation initiator family protein [Gammaproteobacteria bacterium]